MQTVEIKDDVGNLLFTVSSKNPGTFPTPTPQLAYEWFKQRLCDEINKHKDELVTPLLIRLIKQNVGNWFNYSLEHIEFNKYGKLVRFEVKQSIKNKKLELY